MLICTSRACLVTEEGADTLELELQKAVSWLESAGNCVQILWRTANALNLTISPALPPLSFDRVSSPALLQNPCVADDLEPVFTLPPPA